MDNLKIARVRAGLTQTQLSALSGITVMGIRALEHQKTKPWPQTRQALEKTLRKRINWLETTGLQLQAKGPAPTWEAVEGDLRDVLQNVARLPDPAFTEFMALAREYLATLEELRKKGTS